MFNQRNAVDDLAFKALYDETFTMLFRVARRITASDEAAEDVVHDSYIKAVERWGIFPTKDDAKYWLIRVVKNNALNWIKRKGREQKVYQRYLKEMDGVSESPEDVTIKGEASVEIRRYLDRLPEKYRMVLVLKEYGLLNYKEIGRVLGIAEGNVKVRVFRAREALAAMMREDGNDVSRS
ncbi:MAG: RNA polymerase subunit sigma-24 [Spirochaetae bacterium HGW-Spirochaetae-7]|nr:MAG: RNA polymerase subunit sigma-24 [Spirochaetae bacterium HGW-Spirochaetae-7]